MCPSFKGLFAVDRLVHEPARLAILTALDACRVADFQQLSSASGLLSANLSTHLARLAAAGLIDVVKTFRGKRAHTEISLTMAGEYAIRHHWTCLDDARKAADAWRTRTGDGVPPVRC